MPHEAIPHGAERDAAFGRLQPKRRRRCALPAHSQRRAAWCALLLSAFWLPLSGYAQYALDWWTVDSGGGTSTGGGFSVSGTIGQPDAGVMSGGPFTLTGGFWAWPQAVQTPGAPTLSITAAGPGLATISWTPATGTNWILQERPSLSAGSWTNSPSGSTNPVTVPAALPTKFYRLLKP